MTIRSIISPMVAAAILMTSLTTGAQAYNASRASNDAAALASDSLAIRGVLSTYEAAVNASSTDRILALYSEDAVFMPPFNDAIVGATAIRQGYSAGFQALAIHVTITIVEIGELAPDWAFVRSSSAGSVTPRVTGVATPERNKELFLLHRGADRKWKIARYSYSPSTPRP